MEVVSLLAFIELLTECYERVEWEVKGYKNLVGNCNEDDVRINDSKIVLLARYVHKKVCSQYFPEVRAKKSFSGVSFVEPCGEGVCVGVMPRGMTLFFKLPAKKFQFVLNF